MMRRTADSMRGFTIIELMITLTLLSILLAFALPSFSAFIRDSQIRTASSAIENGLQLARAEAVRRNDEVQFNLLGTLNGAAVAGGTDWSVMASDPATPTVFDQSVQMRRESSASTAARVGVAAAVSATAATAGAGLPNTITFTGLGRINAATTTRQIDITGAAGARRLSIQLTPGGEIRMCDPAVSLATNPQGCS